MTDQTYNGWPNYETWCVHLWLSNDQGAYEWARDLAGEAKSDLAGGEAIRQELETDLEDRFEDPASHTCTGLFFDMLRHSLHRVDWHKIGQAFREE